jgi:hypothetical protein
MVATGDVIEVALVGCEQHRHDGRGYPFCLKPYARRQCREP